MRDPRHSHPVLVHPLAWVLEPLEAEPTLLVRPMFGGRAVYVRGRFVLFLAAKAEPWRGVLVPTERAHQPSLIAEFPTLRPHPVLPKWLYLSESAASFDRDVAQLVRLIRAGDARIGIEPNPEARAARRSSSSKRARGPRP